MTPDFIIAGASRSGTTTLCSYLNSLPNVHIPSEKEIRYFDQDELYCDDNTRYESFFSNTADNIVGECSPPYFYKLPYCSDLPAERIYSYSSNMKIIFTLRNPAYRTYSQFCKKVCEGKEECESLRAAVNEELEGIRSPTFSSNCYIWQNLYPKHINRFKTLFGSENILILFFENWISKPQELRRLHDFLNVTSDVKKHFIGHKNALGYPRNRYINDIINKLARRNSIRGNVKDNILAKLLVFLNRILNRQKKPRPNRQIISFLEGYFERSNRVLAREFDLGGRVPWL